MVIVAHPAGVDVGNNLLRKLNPTDFEALKPHLQKIALPAGTIIHEPGDQVTSCYFPCESSMATFIVMLESGQGVEAALIGREGAVGGTSEVPAVAGRPAWERWGKGDGACYRTPRERGSASWWTAPLLSRKLTRNRVACEQLRSGVGIDLPWAWEGGAAWVGRPGLLSKASCE